MRKYLYATTAIVAASALAGPAAAEDPVSLGVSGVHIFNAEYVVQDTGVGDAGAGRRSHIFNRWGTVTFSGNTTLDNGLQVGASFDFKTEIVPADKGGGVEDAYVWLEFGGFRTQLGARNGASNTMHYQSPTPSMWGWGLESSVFGNPLQVGDNKTGYSSTYITSSGDSEKITIFTPRVEGFQLGASYTPENCQQARGSCSGRFGLGIVGGPQLQNDGGVDSIWEVGANYVGSFEDVDINVSAGVLRGSQEVPTATTDDLEVHSLGFQASTQGFTFGAAHRSSNGGASSGGDVNNWSVGLRYATGPWGIGVQYINMDAENDAEAGDDEYNAYEIGGTYDIGPGIQFAFGYQHHELKDNLNNAANENEVDAVFMGNVIYF